MTREEALQTIKEKMGYYESDKRLRDAIETLIPKLNKSEDERIIDALILELKTNPCIARTNGYNRNSYITWLEKQKEQKPAEWSEVEMKVLDSIIDDYEKAARSFCGYDGKIALLKAIRDGEYNLSKQEWGKEDETMINHIIEALPKWANGLITILPSQAEEYVKRLKSLRPQPCWKPSKEQMGALNYAYCELFKREDVEHNILGPLQKLIDQLKKL